jgi:protein-S-isoprenylcysteine O-methyltransferase Ste14
MLPTLLMLPLMVRRTLIEERMLANALPGYTEYTRQVRFRIIPGVW